MSGTPVRNYGSTMDEPAIGFAIPSQSAAAEAADTFDKEGFERIAVSVVSNITAVAKHAGTLEKTLKTIGGKHDSKHVRDAVHVVQVTANKTISNTTKDLEKLSHMIQNRRQPGNQEKMRFTKLSNEFSTVVRTYTDLQKQIVAKMKVTYLPESRGSIQMESDDDQSQALVDRDQAQAQAQRLQETLEFEQGMLVERQERIQQIESDIIDINVIMRQLATMVEEQGEAVASIEDNIQAAYDGVEAGRQELQKAQSYQTKRRKRLFCLLGTGVIALIIVIIILVEGLRK